VKSYLSDCVISTPPKYIFRRVINHSDGYLLIDIHHLFIYPKKIRSQLYLSLFCGKQSLAIYFVNGKVN